MMTPDGAIAILDAAGRSDARRRHGLDPQLLGGAEVTEADVQLAVEAVGERLAAEMRSATRTAEAIALSGPTSIPQRELAQMRARSEDEARAAASAAADRSELIEYELGRFERAARAAIRR